MGTTPSMPSSRKRPIRRSFRSPFRRTSSTQGALSATYNCIEPSMKIIAKKTRNPEQCKKCGKQFHFTRADLRISAQGWSKLIATEHMSWQCQSCCGNAIVHLKTELEEAKNNVAELSDHFPNLTTNKTQPPACQTTPLLRTPLVDTPVPTRDNCSESSNDSSKKDLIPQDLSFLNRCNKKRRNSVLVINSHCQDCSRQLTNELCKDFQPTLFPLQENQMNDIVSNNLGQIISDKKCSSIFSKKVHNKKLNCKLNQLNINLATEEELMTLPGITRGIAKNIIDYRNVIGRFNKVEDLALVSGIGADKLDEIRPEICVIRRRNQSSGSSEGSPESLPIDINRANVFELMSIRGLGQELAAAIVHYRERRGDFFTLSDLIKVKGMNETKLNYLKPRLCLKSDLSKLNKRVLSEPRIPNGGTLSEFTSFLRPADGLRKEPPVKPIACQGDLYELVSQQCERPQSRWDPLPSGETRFASWHLTDMCRQKAANTAVRETFALTLLENRISFVAVQGIKDAISLHMLCSEINSPSCRKVAQWPEARGSWESQFFPTKDKLGLGFVYDTHTISHVFARDIQDNSMMRASVATIVERGCEISVLNVQLFSNSDGSSFNTLTSSVRPSLISGDLSHITGNTSLPNYMCLLPGTKSNISSNEKAAYNNIYIKETDVSKYTGISGIVVEGLRHLAIPDGWAWGGPVSQHAPVWVQLRL